MKNSAGQPAALSSTALSQGLCTGSGQPRRAARRGPRRQRVSVRESRCRACHAAVSRGWYRTVGRRSREPIPDVAGLLRRRASPVSTRSARRLDLRRARAHAAAGPRRRAVRARRHAAVQGRDRRRRRGARGPATSTGRRTRSSTTRSSTSTPAASRPTPSPSSAELTKRGELARVGGAPYLHTLIASVPTAANAGYYARDRARARHPAPPGRGRHPDRRRWATPRDGATSTTSSTAPRPRSTRSPSSAPREDYVPLERHLQGALDEIEAIGRRGGRCPASPPASRPRRAHQRPAPGPDGHRRRPPGDGQGARSRHPAADADRLDHDGRGRGRRPAAGRRRPADHGRRRDRGDDGPPVLRGRVHRRHGDRRRRRASRWRTNAAGTVGAVRTTARARRSAACEPAAAPLDAHRVAVHRRLARHRACRWPVPAVRARGWSRRRDARPAVSRRQDVLRLEVDAAPLVGRTVLPVAAPRRRGRACAGSVCSCATPWRGLARRARRGHARAAASSADRHGTRLGSSESARRAGRSASASRARRSGPARGRPRASCFADDDRASGSAQAACAQAPAGRPGRRRLPAPCSTFGR